MRESEIAQTMVRTVYQQSVTTALDAAQSLELERIKRLQMGM